MDGGKMSNAKLSTDHTERKRRPRAKLQLSIPFRFKCTSRSIPRRIHLRSVVWNLPKLRLFSVPPDGKHFFSKTTKCKIFSFSGKVGKITGTATIFLHSRERLYCSWQGNKWKLLRPPDGMLPPMPAPLVYEILLLIMPSRLYSVHAISPKWKELNSYRSPSLSPFEVLVKIHRMDNRAREENRLYRSHILKSLSPTEHCQTHAQLIYFNSDVQYFFPLW